MGAALPKQFLEIGGTPVIMYTLRRLEASPVVDRVVIACIDGWRQTLAQWVLEAGLQKVAAIVPGGATRSASTRRGMAALQAADDDVVIVHDAVRPLVSDRSLASVASSAARYGNGMAVLECTDTMYECTAPLADGGEGNASRVLDRTCMVRGLTPEAVTGRRLREMYARADARGVQDDSISALQSRLGWEIHLAAGDRVNLKLTRPEDVELFRALLLLRQSGEVRGFEA